MRKATAVLALALCSLVQAQMKDFWTVVDDSGTILHGGDVVYSVRNSAGVAVNIALDMGNMDKGSGFSDLSVTAYKFRGNLTTPELQLFADHLTKLAVNCFNMDASRGTAIRAWVQSAKVRERPFYQTVPEQSSDKSFGPVKMSLTRWVNTQAHSVSVYISRDGIPGQTPWLKTCLPSG